MGKQQEIQAASEALANELDREVDAVKFGDLIIDDHTGEILEMPEGIGEPIAWLTHEARQAQAAMKAWEQRFTLLKLAIGRKLREADLRSLATEYGTPGWRHRVTRKGLVDRLPIVVESFELSLDQARLLLDCAASLDAGRLDEIPPEAVPREAVQALIEEKLSEWVQIEPPRPEPSAMERVRVKREGAQE